MSTLDDNSIGSNGDDLSLTGEAKSHLNETRKWTNFLSILGFIFLGLLVVFVLFALVSLSFVEEAFDMPGGSAVGLIVGYLIIGALYIFPLLSLYRFGNMRKMP